MSSIQMLPHKINYTTSGSILPLRPTHTWHCIHTQWRCMIVVIWPVDVQNVLRQSLHVCGVGVVVRWCRSAPLIISLLRGTIVLPLSSTRSLQCPVSINIPWLYNYVHLSLYIPRGIAARGWLVCLSVYRHSSCKWSTVRCNATKTNSFLAFSLGLTGGFTN